MSKINMANLGLSAEQLAQLRALLDAVAPKSPDWMDGVKTVGNFIGQAGWPIVALLGLFLFRGPIGRIRSLTWKGLSIEMEVERAGKRADAKTLQELKNGPTAEDIDQSGQVGKLADGIELQSIRATAEVLAAEYERTRATMIPGYERTRRMEVVVSKMRVLGRAIIPLRHELMASSTPGKRLAAVASFQVAPDFEDLGWLVQGLATEKPFVSYHAGIALLRSARDDRAKSYLKELAASLSAVATVETTLPIESDRATVLKEFKALVTSLIIASETGVN